MPVAWRLTLSLPQKTQLYFACCDTSIFLMFFLMEAPYRMPYLPQMPCFFVRRPIVSVLVFYVCKWQRKSVGKHGGDLVSASVQGRVWPRVERKASVRGAGSEPHLKLKDHWPPNLAEPHSPSLCSITARCTRVEPYSIPMISREPYIICTSAGGIHELVCTWQ